MESDSIDAAQWLAPLDAGVGGAGIDLRTDFSATSLYQKLRDARASARAEERAREAESDNDGTEAAGWREVLAVGQKALTAHTKDFEIAAWLTEALVRSQGLSGLTAGARLLAGLCESYWDPGFPQPDEDGLEGRASPIGGLAGAEKDGTIMQPLRRLALFRRADGSPVGLYQWEQAEQISTFDEARRTARYEAGAPELKTLEAEARMDKAHLIGVGRSLAASIQAWGELDRQLDARFGTQAPSLRKVTNLLQRMFDVVRQLGGVVTIEDAPAIPATLTGEASAPVASPTPAGAMTRESALRDLDRIAEYFRKTEPHSPLAYTLEDAVRRGRMSLPELLAEVLPDAEARNGLLMRLGIRPEES
jgi:type VI secretion system protein ImpA